MLFNSISFLIFFPLVTLGYFIIPYKWRWIWLLIASYYFYMSWNPVYALLIATSTFITYLCGVLLQSTERIEDEEKRIRLRKTWLILSLVINFSILFFYKYYNFLGDNINRVMEHFAINMQVPYFDVMLPVGISFYTFQAIGYTMDVYRRDIKAEMHLGKYALFISFFPQLVAGPIERSGNLLKQFYERHTFDLERAKRGFVLMLWGFFQKVVIADRVAILVNQVYGNYEAYAGFEIALATVLFSIQIYCDFAGYTYIAIGAAKIMGFELMQNFNTPYFAKSIKEFWRRWHISLSGWFKDYLYIPLGGSRCSRLKRYRNIMITFLVSGIWHGSGWNYIIWGGLHGMYQVVGDIIAPFRQRVAQLFGLNKEKFSYKCLQVLTTFILVDFAWIFFRTADSASALGIIKQMFSSFNPWIFFDQSLYQLGLDQKDFGVMMISIILMIAVELVGKHYDFEEAIAKEHCVFTWAVFMAIILGILIFGVYGPGYAASQFIYFQF